MIVAGSGRRDLVDGRGRLVLEGQVDPEPVVRVAGDRRATVTARSTAPGWCTARWARRSTASRGATMGVGEGTGVAVTPSMKPVNDAADRRGDGAEPAGTDVQDAEPDGDDRQREQDLNGERDAAAAPDRAMDGQAARARALGAGP